MVLITKRDSLGKVSIWTLILSLQLGIHECIHVEKQWFPASHEMREQNHGVWPQHWVLNAVDHTHDIIKIWRKTLTFMLWSKYQNVFQNTTMSCVSSQTDKNPGLKYNSYSTVFCVVCSIWMACKYKQCHKRKDICKFKTKLENARRP